MKKPRRRTRKARTPATVPIIMGNLLDSKKLDVFAECEDEVGVGKPVEVPVE